VKRGRFTAGLLLGVSASGIAYACQASPLWVFLIGLIVAVLVWFGEFILDDLL
jgi:hypothetical protein